jgi:hypothetical protein
MIGCNASPRSSISVGAPLDGLASPRDGRAMHESSWDRSGGNADMRVVEPGQTITLFDHRGAGIVRRFWVTIAPRSHAEIHRQAILRMYWDDEPTPSVEVPIGDFFGVGFGQQVDYISLPLNQTSGGYNCYWPMPFHKSAKWTLTNLSGRRIDAFYYNIDFTGYEKLPTDLMHFHAQWRRENPTTDKQNYTILEAAGRGHFVGCAMFMQARRGGAIGYLEGDEMIHIDGESQPSIIGTGTEDYFSSGWYFDRGTYSAPYHGVQIKDDKLGRINAYRWHIEDAMPFRKSIKVTIEHGHGSTWPADYSSVAFWYQSEPHAPFPSLPADPKDLLPITPLPPMKIEGAIEAEDLLASAKSSRRAPIKQEMSNFPGEWSGDAQLFWSPEAPDASLTLNLPAPAAGTYRLIGHFTRAPDYATIQMRVGSQFVAPRLDLFAENVEATGPTDLGMVRLGAGDNSLTISVVGKNPRSTNVIVGIDAFVLRRAD